MAALDLTPLVGCEITQITLDHRVVLLLASHDGGAPPRVSAWLAIEAPFVLETPDEAVTVQPDDFSNYDRVPQLLGSHVVEACVADDRSLVLVFSDSRSLRSARSPQFESWELGGMGVQPWLALPTSP